jgi:hypothetical protein
MTTVLFMIGAVAAAVLLVLLVLTLLFRPFRIWRTPDSGSWSLPVRQILTRMRLSVFLPLVAKIAMAGALHDGLRARELYVRAKTLGEREVRAADQQESKLRFTQLLVELCVPASSDIDLIGILRLGADTVVEGATFGERGKRQRHALSHVLGFFRPPPLLAEATINIA